jgi:hypothetical protein
MLSYLLLDVNPMCLCPPALPLYYHIAAAQLTALSSLVEKVIQLCKYCIQEVTSDIALGSVWQGVQQRPPAP